MDIRFSDRRISLTSEASAIDLSVNGVHISVTPADGVSMPPVRIRFEMEELPVEEPAPAEPAETEEPDAPSSEEDAFPAAQSESAAPSEEADGPNGSAPEELLEQLERFDSGEDEIDEDALVEAFNAAVDGMSAEEKADFQSELIRRFNPLTEETGW